MTVRVYVPSTLTRLRDVLGSGVVGPAPLAAHAVTPAVRAELPGEEDQEYAASAAAARACVALLGPGDPDRRVVLAVDVESVEPGDGEDPTLVRVPEAVPLRRLGAVLADSADAERAVADARQAVGTERGERALDRLDDHELGWWAAQEADVLLVEAGLDP